MELTHFVNKRESQSRVSAEANKMSRQIALFNLDYRNM
jgi:hypothetical protein